MQIMTIGHSTLSYERFIKLLRFAEITAIADVRSSPYSKNVPHFNRERLRGELQHDGIRYVFLGDELGGRPKDPRLFTNGVADYDKMAKTSGFSSGIKRVMNGASKYKIALLCSEKSPFDCHRCLLVGRALHNNAVSVDNILHNETLLSQSSVELDLLDKYVDRNKDLFVPMSEQIAHAYASHAQRVAYSESRYNARHVS